MADSMDLEDHEIDLIRLFRSLSENDQAAVSIHVARVSLAGQKPPHGAGRSSATVARKIYNEGMTAYRAGGARVNCPYGSEICRARWTRGWDDAKATQSAEEISINANEANELTHKPAAKEITQKVMRITPDNLPVGNFWEADGSCWRYKPSGSEPKGYRLIPMNLKALGKGAPTSPMSDFMPPQEGK